MDDLSFLDFDIDLSSPSVVGAYDELPLWSAMFGQLLLDEVPIAGATSVLDVGCGTGFPLIELAERLGPRATVHGIDTWTEALARAAGKVRARKVRNVEIHEGNVCSMPFGDASFDLIVSNLGLNNFDDRVTAVRECRRVAKTGATLALTTNLRGHMREFYATFERVLHEVGNADDLERLAMHVDHRATLPSLRTLLDDGRFTLTRVVERDSVMRFSNGTALLNHYFIKLGFLGGWKSVVPHSARETFARLRTVLDEDAAGAGELRLTVPMAYVEARAR